ncbi:MAG: F0F1 ATP synthase subunit B [Planctomycetes bacterium]|nr:F0F1 ATP synthase subunit B [Planctomycetota bacterium]
MTALLLQLASGDDYLLDPHGFGLVFWTGLIFGFVSLLLYKIAWGPLLIALEERESKISGAIEEAQTLKAEAEAEKKRFEDKMETARQAAQAIIDEGEADKKRILADARLKAVTVACEIKDRAERNIALAKNKALDEVKETAADLGMAIAAKVIQAEVQGAKHKAVVKDVLDAFEKGQA